MNMRLYLITLLVIPEIIYSQNIDSVLNVTPDFEYINFDRFEESICINKYEEIRKILPNGNQLWVIKSNQGSSVLETPVDSYFAIRKNYYPNGNISSKGLTFVYLRFQKGTWYYFNEDGTFRKAIDHDAPFKFSFENVMEFADKEGVMFTKAPVDWDQYIRIPVLRRKYDPDTQECWWEIEVFRSQKFRIEVIRLDGITGEVVSRTYLELDNGTMYHFNDDGTVMGL